MLNAKGFVHKYGDNVDTDVIIPARYLNIADKKELATHCMEDIDKNFVHAVKAGDVMVGGFNFGCGSSREHAPMTPALSPTPPRGKPIRPTPSPTSSKRSFRPAASWPISRRDRRAESHEL